MYKIITTVWSRRRRREGRSRTEPYETLMVREKGRGGPTNRRSERTTREVGGKPSADGVVKAKGGDVQKEHLIYCTKNRRGAKKDKSELETPKKGHYKL